jgi:His-Xaa-Ser system radical SAM maturase HxsC
MYLHSLGTPRHVKSAIIGKITKLPVLALDTRSDFVAFATPDSIRGFDGDWRGYGAVLSTLTSGDVASDEQAAVFGVKHLEYLSDGDVVRIAPNGTVHTLFRRNSPHNTILATERCNSLCLMCSQPPREIDDSFRAAEILRLIDLIDPSCEEVGISGGEPTLLGEDFLRIVAKFEEKLPHTALHILTNGRRLKDSTFAERLAAIDHPDLMLGIPLYSDVDSQHDYVVQAPGAFSETVTALYNLARVGILVEIRVVLHAQTYRRLPQLAEFIYRNFPFVSHVALMGMEMFGFVHKNMDVLWIDPADYQRELEEATLALAMRGLAVSVYNHQLCTIPRSIWPFARKSISDWKNVYLEECEKCAVKEACGGFFHSATKRHSAHIRAISKGLTSSKLEDIKASRNAAEELQPT